MTITQLALVLLAAPAATAGAICLDKARGTLAHVMVTDLTDREVVLGKLAARLVPVLNLIACALPVAALGTLMGGIDPVALTAAFLIAEGWPSSGVLLALALSVWMSKAHEVMIVVFAVWVLWLLALPVFEMNPPGFWAPHWLKVSNPFWLSLAPYNVPGMTSLWEPSGFLLACLLVVGRIGGALGGEGPAGLPPAGEPGAEGGQGLPSCRLVPPSGPVVARPFARQEPGPLAGVAPESAVEGDPDRLGALHRADLGVQPQDDLGPADVPGRRRVARRPRC